MQTLSVSINTVFRILSATAVVVGCSTAHAIAVMDQMTVNPSSPTLQAGALGKTIGTPGTPDRQIEATQSLTVAINGHLAQIDLWLGKQPDTQGELQFQILRGLPASDEANSVFSATIAASAILSTNIFNFSKVSVDVAAANLTFNAGETFSVHLSALGTPISTVEPYYTPFSWALDANVLYPGGSRFVREAQIGPNWIESNADQAVASWVVASSVPEASTALLLSIGALILIFHRRQQSMK